MKDNDGFELSDYDMVGEAYLQTLYSSQDCKKCGGNAQHHTTIKTDGTYYAKCNFPKDENEDFDPNIQSYYANKNS